MLIAAYGFERQNAKHEYIYILRIGNDRGVRRNRLRVYHQFIADLWIFVDRPVARFIMFADGSLRFAVYNTDQYPVRIDNAQHLFAKESKGSLKVGFGLRIIVDAEKYRFYLLYLHIYHPYVLIGNLKPFLHFLFVGIYFLNLVLVLGYFAFI